MNRYILYIIIILYTVSCKKSKTLFSSIPSSQSGIYFNNQIIENDSINALDIVNVYNGGGVGVGDFNNDGLQDIYFTGSRVSNKLYLNKGNLKFDDITNEANVDGKGRWSRGVSIVDINNDGLLDIYVCCTIIDDNSKRQNILYINRGTNNKGVPYFTDMAAEYGLNDTSYSTMATFFDYDNDGDLDMYLVVNVILKGENPNAFRNIFQNGEFPSTGRLFRNDWNVILKHPVFVNVSKKAGITIEGYGHSATVTDINNDGWKDIYVANDFVGDNILYVNNQDGTFSNKVKNYFKHTSYNSMGQDIVDINNDGLQDVIELDMNPEDNYRKKTMMNGSNYNIYQNFEKFNHQYQYVRNVLQLNQGPMVKQHDSIGNPVFSDVGFLAGIAETDWSWALVVTDFDNDGFRDIIITNGFPKDVTDHDFIAFRNKSIQLASKSTLLSQIPEVKLHNYAFRNNGDLTFTDFSSAWGLSIPTFSNGAAYVDLDNDGDMDLVVNNINGEASIYENRVNNGEEKNNHHFLELQLVGDSLNRNGLGAKINIYYNGKQQVYEENPYRGYLSTMQLNPHFGLGAITLIDSLIIKWPNNRVQKIVNFPIDRKINIDIKDATESYDRPQQIFVSNTLFTEITDSIGINYWHEEEDFNDFGIQKLLPHKLSEYGPALATGDLDGNGLDDLVIGGSVFFSPVILFQQSNGTFFQKTLLPGITSINKKWEEMGIALFDMDGDGDLDIYSASGGYESGPGTYSYQDKLYINDGRGHFKIDSLILPKNYTSKSCVRVADYDKDGDLDIFVGGRVEPWNYPKPVSSFIYRNDSKKGLIRFTDITSLVANSLNNIGMVCDALWTDFDNDGWQDLILAGEWMPLRFLKNNRGILEDVSPLTGLANKIGFWNSIIPGDFDNDGDIDYIVGNVGENIFYKGSEKYPISIYAKDFYNIGMMQCIPVKYLKDKTGILREYTTHTMDDVVDQMPFIKKKFLAYKAFAEATVDQLFTPEQFQGALKLKANYFKSAFVRNNGNGTFEITALPVTAQFSSINGMIAEDFDGDGNLDVLICGNDYGTEISAGRYDALNGLVLKGDGKGSFSSLSILQSGWFVPGNAKALVSLKSAKGKMLVAASQNRGLLKFFSKNKEGKYLSVKPDDETAYIYFTDGRIQKHEFNYGSSFLSQSGRYLNLPEKVRLVNIINSKGIMHSLKF